MGCQRSVVAAGWLRLSTTPIPHCIASPTNDQPFNLALLTKPTASRRFAVTNNRSYHRRIARRSISVLSFVTKKIAQHGGCCPLCYLSASDIVESRFSSSVSAASYRWMESKCLFQLLDLLTFGLWSKLGRLTHYAFDAVLRKCPFTCQAFERRGLMAGIQFPPSLRE